MLVRLMRHAGLRSVPVVGPDAGVRAYGLADEVIGGPAAAPESGTPA